MKKTLTIILCVAVLMGFAGCTDIAATLTNEFFYAHGDPDQYKAILNNANIQHASPVMGDHTASFVKLDGSGNVLCMDYVYSKDVVTAWAETTYVPIGDWTTEMIIQLKINLQEEMMYLDLLECCTVEHEQTEEYYIVTCTFTNVDKEENYAALFRAELSDKETAISMKSTEDWLLTEGYTKQ